MRHNELEVQDMNLVAHCLLRSAFPVRLLVVVRDRIGVRGRMGFLTYRICAAQRTVFYVAPILCAKIGSFLTDTFSRDKKTCCACITDTGKALA